MDVSSNDDYVSVFYIPPLAGRIGRVESEKTVTFAKGASLSEKLKTHEHDVTKYQEKKSRERPIGIVK